MELSSDLMPHADSYAWSKEEVSNCLFNSQERISYKTWNKGNRGSGFHQRIFKKVYIDEKYTYYVKCIICGDTLNNIFKYDWRTGTHPMKKHFENEHSHLGDHEIPPLDETLENSKNLATDSKDPQERDRINRATFEARKEAARKAPSSDQGPVVKKKTRIRLRTKQPTDKRISFYMYGSDDSEEMAEEYFPNDDAAIDNGNSDQVNDDKCDQRDQAVKLLTNLLDAQCPDGKKRLEDYTEEDFEREKKELTIKKARLEVKELEIRVKRQEEQKLMYQSVHNGFKNLVKTAKAVIGPAVHDGIPVESGTSHQLMSGSVNDEKMNNLLEEAYRETVRGFRRPP